MCGINGIFGATHVATKLKKDYLYDALVTGATRGEDSTGLAMLPMKGGINPVVWKKAMAGQDFVHLKTTTKLTDKLEHCSGVILHNRSTTKGYTDDLSAHPFQHGEITLVHNGTVTNHGNLHKDCTWAQDQVDSDNVAKALSLMEPEVLLPKLEGGFSLVWWDARDGSLNFARNDLKPMNWIWSKDGKTLYFGSEILQMWWLLWRNELDVKSEIHQTKPLVHYKFKNCHNLEQLEKTPFQKPSGKSKPVATVATAIPSTATKEAGKEGWTTKVGKEQITAGLAECIINIAVAEKNQKRDETFLELAKIWKVAAGVPLPLRMESWIPYVEKGEEKTDLTNNTRGWLKCRHLQSGKEVQLFGVTLEQYTELVKDNPDRVCIGTIEGFRQSLYLAKDRPVVFVGSLRTDLKLKKTKEEHTLIQTEGAAAGQKMYVIGRTKKRQLSEQDVSLLLTDGCYYCYRNLHLSDLQDIEWDGDNEDEPVCSYCSIQTNIQKKKVN